ncbi:lipopolysaccharide biosynthesis protein [Vibrio furnissii]|uniref:lipopolysaccharide biosynthesis protein n=1 Tax=Vibrio furnissii TaxID=29494 RepID=UPI002573E17E|nr:oligosaccharide flippase family protein [Vibrio furnissii]WJG21757.1 oligosaccharide flippase family protein [Vibrio furnissii]
MSLIKSLSIYTLSSLLSRAVPFFLLPIMTKYLSPDEYGEVSIYIVLMTFLSTVMYWGSHVHLGIEYFKVDKIEYRKILGNVLLIPFVMFIMSSLIFYIFGNVLLTTDSLSHELFLTIPLAAFLGYLYRIMTVHFRVSNQQIKFAITEVSSSILQVFLSILFVVLLSYSVEGRVLAILLSSLLVSIVLVIYIKRYNLLEFKFNIKFYRDYAKTGLAFVFNELGNQVIRIGDKLLILFFVGSSYVGSYAVAAQVASIALILNSVFTQAWQPHVFKILSNDIPINKKKLQRLTFFIAFTFLVIYVLLGIISNIIYSWFIDPRYHDSLPVVIWLLSGFYFTFIYGLFADYIFFSKEVRKVSFVTLFNLTIFVSLSIILLNRYGAFGVAYAFCISSLSSSCLCAYLSSKCRYSLFKLNREVGNK